MKMALVAGVVIVVGTSLAASQVAAQDRLLTPNEKRAYHACLFTAWIDDYCLHHGQGYSEIAFRECVIANLGGRSAGERPFWGPGIETYCRASAQLHGR